jgi:hypothetical protein
MTQETWLVFAVGAGFLLLGIAASPLAWVALLHRREQSVRDSERGVRELGDQLRFLRARLERCEAFMHGLREVGTVAELSSPSDNVVFRRPAPPGKTRPARGVGPALDDDPREPRLITVPKLASAQDRLTMQGGLSQRYAAIWDLAEKGASPDVIARATGQPIGQIELILGLRRQLDANRTNIPHASHE